MSEKKESSNDFAGRELTVTRLLNAPVELVWEVWSKPEHIKNWWGPNGFTNTITKMEFNSGGIWELVMHGPDGTNYPNQSRFKEVVKHERIVYEHISKPSFLTTVTFKAEGKKTRINWHMLFATKEEFEWVVKTHKADKGLEQNIEKMEVYLAQMPAKPELVITRIIDAPRALVYKVWTDPLHLQQWWGPKNFTNPVCELDVRPGGNIYIDMTGPDGTIYPCLGNFIELVESEKIVFSIRSHEDKNGNAGLETLNTVTFTEWEGKTKLKLVAKVIKATPEVAQSLAGMEQGWTESIDRLEHHSTASSKPPLIMERIYNAPIQLVWKALSDNAEMKRWYFQLPEFRPEVGFKFQFSGGPGNGKVYLHMCEITEVVPGKKLTYSWRYDGYEGISFVTFELFAEGNKTRLKLTHAGLETFPASNPDFAKHNFVAGWGHIIGTTLWEFVEREFNAK